MHSKVLVLGLDALSFLWLKRCGLLCEWISLADRYGILKSTLPPITPPAWTSIVTGVHPGYHGIWSFTDLDTGAIETINRSYAPLLWEILEELSIKSAWLWFPFTYPVPRTKHSFFISGEPIPPEFLSNIMNFVNNPLNISNKVVNKALESLYRDIEVHNSVKALLDSIDMKYELIKDIIERNDLSLVFCVISETDRIIHHTSNVTDIKVIYERVHELTLDIIDYAKRKNYKVIVVSDHGSAEFVNKIFLINNFFIDLGLLKNSLKFKIPKQVKGGLEKLYYLFSSNISLDTLTSLSKKLFAPAFGREWFKGYVYGVFGTTRIIYVRIRKNSDTLSQAVRNLLVSRFNNIINKVYFVKDLYRPCRGNCKDLLVIARPGVEITSFSVPFMSYVVSTSGHFIHDMNGVFISFCSTNANNLSRRRYLGHCCVTDVAPSILSLLGIKPPNYMHGKAMFPAHDGVSIENLVKKLHFKRTLKRMNLNLKYSSLRNTGYMKYQG